MQRSIEHDQIMFSGNYTHSMALVIFSSLDRWHVHSINILTYNQNNNNMITIIPIIK